MPNDTDRLELTNGDRGRLETIADDLRRALDRDQSPDNCMAILTKAQEELTMLVHRIWWRTR